jgi:hypothetical protein
MVPMLSYEVPLTPNPAPGPGMDMMAAISSIDPGTMEEVKSTHAPAPATAAAPASAQPQAPAQATPGGFRRGGRLEVDDSVL